MATLPTEICMYIVKGLKIEMPPCITNHDLLTIWEHNPLKVIFLQRS